MFKKLNEFVKTDDIIRAFTVVYGNENYNYINNCFSNMRIAWFDKNNHILENITNTEFEELKLKKSEEVFHQSCYVDEFDLLILPLNVDITQIIHEMNHKLGSHLICCNPLHLINGLCISKEDGFGVKEENYNLSEVVNQKITEEVIEELINMGYKITITDSWQSKLYPIISPFYETYSESIKKCWISGRIEDFKEGFGIDKYKNFSNYLYLKLFKLIRQMKRNEPICISTEIIDEVGKIVSSFNDNRGVKKR